MTSDPPSALIAPASSLQIGVAILARVAQLGRGKTRLATTYGAAETLQIYRQLIATCAKAVRDSGLSARVYFDPAPGDAEVWEPETFVASTQNADANLGVRLAAVAQDALQHFDGVLLLGTDCPYLTGARLQAAAQALRERDAVLGPSLDGGYYLLGLRQYREDLFDAIDWSTEVVAAQTREVLAKAQLDTAELEPLADIDEAADWEAYCRWQAEH